MGKSREDDEFDRIHVVSQIERDAGVVAQYDGHQAFFRKRIEDRRLPAGIMTWSDSTWTMWLASEQCRIRGKGWHSRRHLHALVRPLQPSAGKAQAVAEFGDFATVASIEPLIGEIVDISHS
jgi:hypothetical protein